jgi:hypothetical protein
MEKHIDGTKETLSQDEMKKTKGGAAPALPPNPFMGEIQEVEAE